jgi:Glu-tRNA(Gln) amidotransferase subunit E-like FAD-binding protein
MKTVIYIIPLAFMLSCGSADQKSKMLVEANQLHLESVSIASKLEKSLDSLRQQQVSTAEKIRLDSISGLIALWEESVIEVPGFEHAHHHTEGHEHKPAPQMTDESMLEYQRNAKQAIESIQTQLHHGN